MKKLYWALLLFTWSIKSMAYFDGNTLLDTCGNEIKILNNNGYATNVYQGATQITKGSICVGYINASADIFVIQKLICPPVNITYQQYIRIIYKYLNNTPEELNLPGAIVILRALDKAFPCPKATSK